jgi:hypothetical protein
MEVIVGQGPWPRPRTAEAEVAARARAVMKIKDFIWLFNYSQEFIIYYNKFLISLEKTDPPNMRGTGL